MAEKTVFLIGFLPNPRIYKRIALALRYNAVSLICWDRGSEMLKKPELKDYTIDILSFPAGNDPVSRLKPYFYFRKESLRILERENPSIIHVQGLDMLQIACSYKRRINSNVHIIYEVADLHRLLVDKQYSIIKRFVQVTLRHLDRKYFKKIDLLIITSEKYYDNYFINFVPKDKVFFFPNVPELHVFKNYKRKELSNLFTIGFFGFIRYKDELKLLINNIARSNTRLIIAGTEDNDNEIELMCHGRSDIEWLGRFDFSTQAAELYQKCNAVYAVYNSDMNNCKVALPNKLYEAVYCELPIIVASGTYVGDIVEKWGVGIAIEHTSDDELNEALIGFQNMDQYRRFVQNCVQHKKDVDINEYNDALIKRIKQFL